MESVQSQVSCNGHEQRAMKEHGLDAITEFNETWFDYIYCAPIESLHNYPHFLYRFTLFLLPFDFFQLPDIYPRGSKRIVRHGDHR
jgi:hypothetical protein